MNKKKAYRAYKRGWGDTMDVDTVRGRERVGEKI